MFIWKLKEGVRMVIQISSTPANIEKSLKVIYKTGRVEIGYYNVIWYLKHRPKQIKAIIISENIPQHMLDSIMSLAEKKKVKIYRSEKTNIQLGEAIGRKHSVATLAILDFGSISVEEEFA